MIDFSKLGTGSTADTVLAPRDLFNVLPGKASKFQYPRDVQSQVWSKWFERRHESNLVMKMNTGSGKTVVGLVLLKSCLNEGKAPAVYICPDKYLVKQVKDAAAELGIEVTEDVNSPRFQSGKAILVANIYKLVNGKSVFGVGDEGAKLKVSSLVIDDAHACLETVEDQFTIKIPSGCELYSELMALFMDSLVAECETKAIEIQEGDQSSSMLVPYWTWQDKITDIARLFVKHKYSNELKFVWPLIKEDILLCDCVVSSKEVEISPHAIPIHMIPSVVNAERKVFMTATLVDDSILSSHFGVNEHELSKAIVPDSAGDIGDRMIILPQVINTETTDENIKSYCKACSKNFNVVVIVPSAFRANYWADVADLTLTTTNLYEGVERLKNGLVGLTILINRYDGIDLPQNACRLLVIDGLPEVRRAIDKINQVLLMGTDRQLNQVLQKIEQGMGRGIRSNDDFCVVFLMGKNLTKHLYSFGAQDKLSPGTKAQLNLSEQLSEQIKGTTIAAISPTLNHCLSRNPDWIKASKSVLASLIYSEENNLDQICIKLREAYDLASNNDYPRAVGIINALIDVVDNQDVKGYLKQRLAQYCNMYDKVEAQKVQLSAASDNRRVHKPIAGIQYHKIQGDVYDQATQCSNFILRQQGDPNKLIIEVDGVLSDLKFKEGTANRFEEALNNIAKYIGFRSQRPEQEYKKGPDNLWSLGGSQYCVIECKSCAVVETITKTYCNQLNGSGEWFENQYDNTCSYTPIMVHNSFEFEFAATPKPNTRIMTVEDLDNFKTSVRDFIKAISVSNELASPEAIRAKLIAYKLRGSEIVSHYTRAFRVRNTG
ncbi:DEAD/DEAH box helicase family protein [Maridesulfovibrio frigidus]|uniref:DEAD/DEAH box helicase family protein n=1 Tax=Maridesulfovibrio frigidus TaxID=340956 RepID=UPI0004E23890|nr:DEAD/DEAH box helicase family protein [Maridesulfovibrio frigidus]